MKPSERPAKFASPVSPAAMRAGVVVRKLLDTPTVIPKEPKPTLFEIVKAIGRYLRDIEIG